MARSPRERSRWTPSRSRACADSSSSNAKLIPAAPRDTRSVLPEARCASLASIRAVYAWIGKNSRCLEEGARIVCANKRVQTRTSEWAETYNLPARVFIFHPSGSRRVSLRIFVLSRERRGKKTLRDNFSYARKNRTIDANYLAVLGFVCVLSNVCFRNYLIRAINNILYIFVFKLII